MQLININQVAEIIGVTGRTVRQYVNAGLLPVFKLPGKSITITGPDGSTRIINRGSVRFERAEVEQALTKFRHAANGEPKRRAGRIAPIQPTQDFQL
jgi:predicted DNA-binding transcriptional regulator AlpA